MERGTSLPPFVLHVEDDPEHQALLRLSLATHCSILTASTIESAVHYLRLENRIRFVLLDGNLPTRRGGPLESTVSFFKEHLQHREDIIVIAASCDDRIEEVLVGLGCIQAEKHNVWKHVLERMAC